MPLFHRKDVPPGAAVALIEAASPEDRVVSWADTADGSHVLASRRGIWWPDGDAWRLIGWQFVDKATWRDGVLTVIEADVRDERFLVDRAPVRAGLAVPRDLPPTVRKRVEANVVRTVLEPVPGGAARYVGRRVPGANGLRWWVRLEPGTPADDRVSAVVTDRLAELAAAWEAERGTDQRW